MPRWFRIKNTDPPWGDYGSILVSGITSRRLDNGRLPYERVGPFMPPITIAGISNLIVSDEFKRQIEGSPVAGLTFLEVEKRRIVRLDWRSWDLTAENPQKYPAGADPENYILGRKHNPELAEAMGSIWEVVVDATVDEPGGNMIVRSAPTPFSHLLASEAAAGWLADNAADWLSITPRQ